MIKSFDIFDTLIARTVREPPDIFSIVEMKFPYRDFKAKRIYAQSMSNQTIEDIYKQFQSITKESDETIQKLRAFELQTEIENTIPIQSNIAKIKDGDIYISDMYLTSDEIKSILKHHNIKDNVLLVSPGGKADGTMWERVKRDYVIKKHIGDNYHSDVVMPLKYHIKSEHTEIHKFTAFETCLTNVDFNLAKVFRWARLSNPHEINTLEYDLYDQQMQLNIPLLVFMCRQLDSICKAEGRSKVLFLTRDGCLIRKLFSVLYPQYQSEYFISSRVLNNKSPPEYEEYVKRTYQHDTCILFDLHGSFRSGSGLFMRLFGHLPRIYIFSYLPNTPEFETLTYFINNGNAVVETMNHDIIGSICNYKNGRPVFLPLENPYKRISIMHEAMGKFLEISSSNTSIALSPLFDDIGFWKSFYANHCYGAKIHVNHIGDHETLETLSKKYEVRLDANILEELVSNRLWETNQETLSILEICEGDELIPMMRLWSEYFHGRVELTGFDNHPRSYVASNMKFVCGNRSNIEDLNKLLNKKYDIIIDHGNSDFESTAFKILWREVKEDGYYVFQPRDENYSGNNDLPDAFSTSFLKKRPLYINDEHK